MSSFQVICEETRKFHQQHRVSRNFSSFWLLQFWSWHWQIYYGRPRQKMEHAMTLTTEESTFMHWQIQFLLSSSSSSVDLELKSREIGDWGNFYTLQNVRLSNRPDVMWINKRVERPERRLKFGFYIWMLLWRRKYLSGSQLSLWKSMAVQIITTNDQNTTSSIQYQEVTLFKGLL